MLFFSPCWGTTIETPHREKTAGSDKSHFFIHRECRRRGQSSWNGELNNFINFLSYSKIMALSVGVQPTIDHLVLPGNRARFTREAIADLYSIRRSMSCWAGHFGLLKLLLRFPSPIQRHRRPYAASAGANTVPWDEWSHRCFAGQHNAKTYFLKHMFLLLFHVFVLGLNSERSSTSPYYSRNWNVSSLHVHIKNMNSSAEYYLLILKWNCWNWPCMQSAVTRPELWNHSKQWADQRGACRASQANCSGGNLPQHPVICGQVLLHAGHGQMRREHEPIPSGLERWLHQ